MQNNRTEMEAIKNWIGFKVSIWHLSAGICQQAFDSRHLTAGICQQAFVSRHLTAGICFYSFYAGERGAGGEEVRDEAQPR
jgi:hypothetical protein